MIINQNPEVAFNFVIGISIDVILVIALLKIKPAQVITLKLIVIGWVIAGFMFIFDAISILFLDYITGILANIVAYYSFLFFLLALNYTSKENFYSLGLLVFIAFGVMLHIAAFIPGSIIVQNESGFLATQSTGLFDILLNVSYLMGSIIILTIGLRSLKYCPHEIKRDAWIFMAGVLSSTVLTIFIYFFVYWNPLMIYPSDLFFFAGAIIWTYCIWKTPKLFYILPFSVYRITIKDKTGNILYNYDWSKLKIKNVRLTKYLDTIQEVSDELIKVGGVADVNFSGGIIIIKEGMLTTSTLFASKGSKILRYALTRFSSEFERRFERELQDESGATENYDSAYDLIEQYFSNFPSRLIIGKSQRASFSRSAENVTREMKERLKAIFMDKAK